MNRFDIYTRLQQQAQAAQVARFRVLAGFSSRANAARILKLERELQAIALDLYDVELLTVSDEAAVNGRMTNGHSRAGDGWATELSL